MRKGVPVLLLVLISSLTSFGQSKQNITGKWKFADVYKPEKIDAEGLSLVREMFGNMTLYFKSNHHYKVFLFKNEEGKWELNETSKKLILTSNRGTVDQFEIDSVTDTTLVLSMKKDQSLLFRKIKPDANDDVEEVVKEVKTVSATEDQVAKKWFLVRMERPNRSEEQIKTLSDLAKGAYYDFKKDKTYKAKVFEIDVVGKWNFGLGNKTIEVNNDGSKTIWNIIKISESELHLVKGGTEDIWKFSDKE